jgi:hypothetical protein
MVLMPMPKTAAKVHIFVRPYTFMSKEGHVFALVSPRFNAIMQRKRKEKESDRVFMFN